MSDARFPAETSEGTDAPRREHMRADETGAEAALQLHHQGKASNGEHAALIPLAPAPETVPFMADASDDLQPMLDLRFPGEAEPPASYAQTERTGPDAAEQIPAEPSGAASMSAADPGQTEIVAFEEIVVGEQAPFEAAKTTGTPDTVEWHAGATSHQAQQADPSPFDHSPSLSSAQGGDGLEQHGAAAPTLKALGGDPLAAEPVSAEEDATARQIAAEADATALALDNLKRLLGHKMPDLAADTTASRPIDADFVQPPPLQAAPFGTMDEPEAAHEAAFDPAALPVPVGDLHRRSARFAFGGFLAGFAASWVVGAVLYAYLVFG